MHVYTLLNLANTNKRSKDQTSSCQEPVIETISLSLKFMFLLKTKNKQDTTVVAYFTPSPIVFYFEGGFN